jgi:hypothetical protein
MGNPGEYTSHDRDKKYSKKIYECHHPTIEDTCDHEYHDDTCSIPRSPEILYQFSSS